jgi:hypothetical protein
LGSHVVVLACCSRTASEVTSRLPKRAASPETTASTAFGLGRSSFEDADGASAGMVILCENTCQAIRSRAEAAKFHLVRRILHRIVCKKGETKRFEYVKLNNVAFGARCRTRPDA